MKTLTRFLFACFIAVYFPTVVVAQDVQAAAAIAIDPHTRSVLYAQNADVVRPIASLTKLMTAAVLLDRDVNLHDTITVQPSDVRRASITYLRNRDRVSQRTALFLMLVASDNAAARVLSRSVAKTEAAFVRLMNEHARNLGLTSTRFVDASGLSVGNQSTANEIAWLLAHVASYPLAQDAMQTSVYQTKIGTRKVSVKNTNRLLSDTSVRVHAGKTGYTSRSGFCVATWLRPQVFANDVLVVVLGAVSNTARFDIAKHVFNRAIETLGPLAFRAVTGIPMQWFPRVSLCGPYPESISPAGMRFIQRHEGLRTRAYWDAGGWNIGYGMRTWKGRKVTKTYPGRPSVSQINAEFSRQIRTYERIVRESVCAALNQSEFDSLVSIAWNLGRVNTRIVDKLHAGASVTEADFLSTATVRGRVHKVLRARRLEEFALFVNNDGDME